MPSKSTGPSFRDSLPAHFKYGSLRSRLRARKAPESVSAQPYKARKKWLTHLLAPGAFRTFWSNTLAGTIGYFIRSPALKIRCSRNSVVDAITCTLGSLPPDRACKYRIGILDVVFVIDQADLEELPINAAANTNPAVTSALSRDPDHFDPAFVGEREDAVAVGGPQKELFDCYCKALLGEIVVAPAESPFVVFAAPFHEVPSTYVCPGAGRSSSCQYVERPASQVEIATASAFGRFVALCLSWNLIYRSEFTVPFRLAPGILGALLSIPLEPVSSGCAPGSAEWCSSRAAARDVLLHTDESFARNVLTVEAMGTGVSSLGLTFTATAVGKGGEAVECALAPATVRGAPQRSDQAAAVPVEVSNLSVYVDSLVAAKLRNGSGSLLAAFCEGFWTIIPQEALARSFRIDELDALLSGEARIELADWKRSVKYETPYTALHPTILLFWEVVDQMSDEERSKLLQFITGTTAVPAGGLSSLTWPVRIKVGHGTLPSAATCVNCMSLPIYETFDECKVGLQVAVQHHLGFGQA